MIVTSIVFDYFKGYVTAFIDITGQAETIFAHPPVKKVRLLVNIVSLIEQFLSVLFLLLLMIRIGVGEKAKGMLWAVVVPVELYFGVVGIASFILFGYFVFCLVSVFCCYCSHCSYCCYCCYCFYCFGRERSNHVSCAHTSETREQNAI